MRKVGFIGTGIMGSRMVIQFLQGGYPVTVYNRTIEKTKALTDLGAEAADSIASLSRQVDIICTCLSMPLDCKEVYLGENGILENAKENTICIDFTTVDPETSKLIYEKAKEKGIEFVDAPVSGGPEGIEHKTLTIMVGGEKGTYDAILPLISTFGKTIELLGPIGSGSVAKLMNQYLVAVHSLAASEVMVTGAALGLESEKLYNVLKESYGNSRMLRRHMSEHVLDRQFEPGGNIRYLHKDVSLANQLLDKAGISKFTGKFAEESFKQAMEEGYADLDMSAIILPLEKESDVQVERVKTKS